MTNSIKHVVWGCIISVALTTCWGCGESSSRNSSAPANKKKSPSLATDTPLAPLVVYRWRQAARYDVVLKSVLKNQGISVMTDLTLTGRVQVVPATKGNKTVIALFIAQPRLTFVEAEGNVDSAKVAVFEQELRQKVMATYIDGVLDEMTFPGKSSALAVGIWRAILSGIQIATGKGGKAPFEVQETDANGTYLASYRQVKQGVWEKKKQQYTKGMYQKSFGSSGKTEGPAPQLLQSAGVIEIQNDELKRISLEEKVQVSLLQAGRLLSETSFEFTHSTHAAAETGEDIAPGGEMTTIAADEPWNPVLPIDAMDESRIGDFTFDDVLEALVQKATDPRRQLVAKSNDNSVDPKTVEGAQDWMEDWSRYFGALPAFFRQQPQTMKRAKKEIRHGSPATISLLGGLSAAGTAESQRILLSLATDGGLEPELRGAAMRNLVQCKQPTAQTAEQVRMLADDDLLARLSVMGTGIIARHLREDGNAQTAKVNVSWLLERLKVEKNGSKRRDILRGIANSAHPMVFEEMKKLINTGNINDRAGALEAIRLLPLPEVDELIAAHLNPQIEASGFVREGAVAAAAAREPVELLRSALVNTVADTNKQVKRKALQVLKKWSRDDESLIPIVEQLTSELTGSVEIPQ